MPESPVTARSLSEDGDLLHSLIERHFGALESALFKKMREAVADADKPELKPEYKPELWTAYEILVAPLRKERDETLLSLKRLRAAALTASP